VLSTVAKLVYVKTNWRQLVGDSVDNFGVESDDDDDDEMESEHVVEADEVDGSDADSDDN
jgi:hypothetical protein